jgi:NAD(P)H-flavin reductase
VSDSLVLRASSVRFATPSTRFLRLDLDGAVFKYLPGQAAHLGLAASAERVPYSIASAPEESARDGYLQFLIKIEPSGRWGHKFDGLGRGMRIAVQGPLGSFTFPDRPAERRFLFIAGGTGIAPIRSMLRHLILTKQPGRSRLLFSARTPEEFAYLRRAGAYRCVPACIARRSSRDALLRLRPELARQRRPAHAPRARRSTPAHHGGKMVGVT